MRKIIFQMMISLDGFFEGPNKEIEWHHVDGEFNRYAQELLDSVDTLLFGRVTYQLMAGYWPTDNAITTYPEIAERMNRLSKIVVSQTLDNPTWQHTKLIRNNIVAEIEQVKRSPGKDIAILGSSRLALTLIPHNLIDVYRIIVNPIILGAGTRLFEGLGSSLKLCIQTTHVFRSGNVLFCYRPR